MRVQVFSRGAQWFIRGGWPYLLGWAAFLVGDTVLHLVLNGRDFLSEGATGALWISLVGAAVVWCVRMALIAMRHPETTWGLRMD